LMCSSSAITVLPLLTRSPRNLDPAGADATIYSTCVQYDSPLAHPPFHRSYATDLPRQSPLAPLLAALALLCLLAAYPSSFRLGRSASLFFRRHFRGMRRWQQHPASCPNPRHHARHLHFHRDCIDSGPQRRTPGRQHSNHGYRHRPIEVGDLFS
jgi:hypothetical protein